MTTNKDAVEFGDLARCQRAVRENQMNAEKKLRLYQGVVCVLLEEIEVRRMIEDGRIDDHCDTFRASVRELVNILTEMGRAGDGGQGHAIALDGCVTIDAIHHRVEMIIKGMGLMS